MLNPDPKTPFNEEELEYFKNLLLEERQQTKNEIDKIKQIIEDQRSLDGDRASQDHHLGNIGSEEEGKETDYILNDRQRYKLKEIDAALERINNNTYGVCEDTGKKIQRERLEALPYARFCVESTKKHETDS